MNSLFSIQTRIAAMLCALFMPVTAMAQNVGQSNDPITSALVWMQSVLINSIAVPIAVMAVAGVGFMMLTGRMNWRFGATVIIGIFIIFGAASLVDAIRGVA